MTVSFAPPPEKSSRSMRMIEVPSASTCAVVWLAEMSREIATEEVDRLSDR